MNDSLRDILKEYRAANALTQAELARILSLDQSYISKIESGRRHIRDVDMLLHIAHKLNIQIQRLGVFKNAPEGYPTHQAAGLADTVVRSRDEWQRVRRQLNQGRRDLAQAAATLYPEHLRLTGIPLLTCDEWLPARPLRMECIRLVWEDQPPDAVITGRETAAQPVLPLRTPTQRFTTYSTAVRYIDPPALFENRASYRLLAADLSVDRPKMTFGLATYFDKIDLSEAVAHELTRTGYQRKHADVSGRLPLRSLIGDPLDLRRRSCLPAIETLTLRRHRATGNASFLLHWRDPAKVATAAGIYGLIPAGEFQPSSVASWNRSNDFSLWRNIVREYSEELLGEPERDGSQGRPIDYDGWSLYRSFQSAVAADEVAAYCLGIGLDTLTLAPTILTAVVIDENVFDELFSDTVTVNSEGVLVSEGRTPAIAGLPFSLDVVTRLSTTAPMASPGAGILAQAWKHRAHLRVT